MKFSFRTYPMIGVSRLAVSLFPLLMGLLMVCFPSCRKERERLYPYGWIASGGEFDSLTLKLENAYFDRAATSEIESLVDSMKRIADKNPRQPEMKSRYHYWNARLALRKGDIDEAMDGFNTSLALTDSAHFPYDVARIRWNMDLEPAQDADGYFRLLNQLNLFRELGDLPYQADYCMQIGGLLSNMGNPMPAFGYFSSADSLLRLSGLYAQASRNVINRAAALDKAGQPSQGAALLRSSLQDSLFCQDPVAKNMAQWNLYLFTDSFPLLKEAYAGLAGDPDEELMRVLYGSHMIKEYVRHGMLDSARAMIPVVEKDTSLLPRDEYFRDFFIARGMAADAFGDSRKAAECYREATEVLLKMADVNANVFVADIENRRQIDLRLHEAELQKRDRTLILVIISAILILIAVVVISLYRRRYLAQRREGEAANQRNEQARRRVIALELAMEENRRLSEDLRGALDALAKDGLVTPVASGQLNAALRSHDLTRTDRESFVETFADVNPKFLEALDAAHPNLSKTERRLAAYISLGLDNKRIARLCGIRPESVKQARWRLRSKMNVPDGVTLEEAIRLIYPSGS